MSTSISVRENVLLAPLTTLKVGGEARFFVSADSESQVVEAFDFAAQNNLPLFVLGGGSNVVISDEGFDGLVLQVVIRGISSFAEKDGTVYVTAGAGEDWDPFVAFCVSKDLQGLECLSGIPGFVGGTPVQNVGAYGQEVSETIVSVRAFDSQKRETITLLNSDCGFTYRTSIFNTTEKERFIVMSVTYALKQNGGPKIVYRDLREIFGNGMPTLAETRKTVLNIRRSKSMVIDEADPNSRSAGSFFKNPVITKTEFARIAKLAEERGIGPVPSFQAPNDHVKVPSAWLIERSGFEKGHIYGRTGLSSRHTLAVINRGGATAAEIVGLKDLIRAGVFENFSISLQTEPVFVGFDR